MRTPAVIPNRVAQYAALIAEELGWTPEEILNLGNGLLTFTTSERSVSRIRS